MGTITRIYYNQITSDDSMNEAAIRDLIRMLESYLDEPTEGEDEW